MIVYRFVHRKFATDLSGMGAKLHGGRWNLTGTSVLYTSGTIALALLEVLVNANSLEALQSVTLMQLTIPDSGTVYQIHAKNLKKNWHHDVGYTQWMGTEILRGNGSLVIECPSAVIQQESNFLLNPLHKDYHKISAKEVSDFYFDERLFPLVNR